MKQLPTLPHGSGGEFAHRHKPNWLLRALILGSIGLHAVMFFHLAGIYQSQAVTVIELSLRNESAPHRRNIPRPRRRPKTPPPDNLKPKIIRMVPPAAPPIKISPNPSDLPDSLAAPIVTQLNAPVPQHQIEPWQPVSVPQFSLETFESPNSYLEMVRFKIEKNKRYPEKARRANMRGRVIISVVITLQGEINSLTIKKSSGHATLDAAALSAVQHAVPFPIPPGRFFKQDLLLNIPILFEMT